MPTKVITRIVILKEYIQKKENKNQVEGFSFARVEGSLGGVTKAKGTEVRAAS